MEENGNNEQDSGAVRLVFSHMCAAALAVILLLVIQQNQRDKDRDRVLCKSTEYKPIIQGEKITFTPVKTEVQVKQKWTCTSEWRSEDAYLKEEVIKDIENGPK